MEFPKILIVDDESPTRRTLAEHLSQRMECHIAEAADGYEAVEKLNGSPIDVLLLDIKMPGISGTEVIQKAREISQAMAIIVITKWDSSEMAKQVQLSGAEYIPKPFSLKVVRAKVEEKLKTAGKFFPKG